LRAVDARSQFFDDGHTPESQTRKRFHVAALSCLVRSMVHQIESGIRRKAS
jgi:hypothetical protein